MAAPVVGMGEPETGKRWKSTGSKFSHGSEQNMVVIGSALQEGSMGEE